MAMGGGTSYADGAIYPFAAAVTLYAQWTASPAGGGSTTSPPTITVISPAFGSTAGGTRMTITGTNFARSDGGRFRGCRFQQCHRRQLLHDHRGESGRHGGSCRCRCNDSRWHLGYQPGRHLHLRQRGPHHTDPGESNSATVADGGGYSGQRTVTNGTGTVSYTEAISADSTDVVVTSTGAISSAKSLSPGTYAVSGNDSDTNDDTGTWIFALTVIGTTPAVPAAAYDMVGSDGGVFVFGRPGTGFYGSLPGIGVHVNDIVGMVTTSDDKGYYLLGRDGGVFAFGDANFTVLCPASGFL